MDAVTHQEKIDHATWIMRRKRDNRCVCATCWAAFVSGKEQTWKPWLR